MADVVSLTTRPQQINADCVDLLRRYLAAAEAGEIVGVAVAAVLPNGASDTEASSSDHFPALAGAIAILQHRLIADSRNAE